MWRFCSLACDNTKHTHKRKWQATTQPNLFSECMYTYTHFFFSRMPSMCVRKWHYKARIIYFGSTYLVFFLFIRERELKIGYTDGKNCLQSNSSIGIVFEAWLRAVKMMPGRHGRNPDEPNCKFFMDIFFFLFFHSIRSANSSYAVYFAEPIAVLPRCVCRTPFIKEIITSQCATK